MPLTAIWLTFSEKLHFSMLWKFLNYYTIMRTKIHNTRYVYMCSFLLLVSSFCNVKSDAFIVTYIISPCIYIQYTWWDIYIYTSYIYIYIYIYIYTWYIYNMYIYIYIHIFNIYIYIYTHTYILYYTYIIYIYLHMVIWCIYTCAIYVCIGLYTYV